MSNYITVDSVSLINLAKAGDPSLQYLNTLLSSTGSTLVLTDTVISEVTFNITYNDSKLINNWVNANMATGNIQIFTSKVPAGAPDAGENSIVEWITDIDASGNNIVAVTDDFNSGAYSMINSALISNNFVGAGSAVVTTTGYLSRLILDGDISLDYGAQALVDGLNAGRLVNFVADPLNDIIWSGSIGTLSLGKTVQTGIPGFTVEYPPFAIQYVTTSNGSQYYYAVPPDIKFNHPAFLANQTEVSAQAGCTVFVESGTVTVSCNAVSTNALVPPNSTGFHIYQDGEVSFFQDSHSNNSFNLEGIESIELSPVDVFLLATMVRRPETDADGNPIGDWQTETVLLDPTGQIAVTRTALSTPNGQIISPFETSIEFTEEYAQSIIDEALRNTNGAVAGNQIGEIFGSTLGQSIAGDNVFAQISTSAVLGTALGNIGQSIGIALQTGEDLMVAIEAAFDDFSANLFDSLKSQSASSVSSFLIAEFSDAFNVPGDFGGQLLTAVGGNITNTLVTNAITDGANLYDGLLVFDDAGNWTPGAGIVTAVGSFLGSYLAHQIVSPETTAGAIGGSLGGSIGAMLGPSLITAGAEALGVIGFVGSLGTVISSILLPGIGAFVGVLLGTVLGDTLAPVISSIWDDWFGNNPPRADAWLNFDPSLGEFISDPAGRRQEGGQREAAVEIAAMARDSLNVFVSAIGGQILNEDSLKSTFAIWEDQKSPFRVGTAFGFRNAFKNAGDQIEAGVLETLHQLRIAGGDLYVKRAIALSQATTLEELGGELKIAQDYSRYIEFKDIIDLLIAADPNSAFSAGWVITLLRAEELGITETSSTDFEGGLASFFKSLGLDRLGATPDDVAISIDGTALRLDIVVDGQTVRTITIDDFANTIGYSHLAAAANGANADGTAGNDIWIANDVASSFTDVATAESGFSNDILIGSNFADTINAGPGWDFVRGNAGGDLIIGGAGNDSLYGGGGNDTIYGDADNGFAPIPTGTNLSDSASTGAPDGFAGSRHTWFGGATADVALSRNYTPPAQSFDEDEIHGGAGNDQLAGGTGDDALHGEAGADTLYGNAGNDLLDGGTGADTVFGGTGFDTASYADSDTGITADLAAATDHGTASDGDLLYSIEDLIGSAFNDTLYGDAFSNIIDGGMGEDVVDGRGGRDTVSFHSSLFGVEINMGTGIAVTAIPGSGGAAATTQTDTFVNFEDVIGSSHDDTLIASANGGGIAAGDGNDTIVLQSDDVDVASGAATYDLQGGDGIDTLDFSGWTKGRGVELSLDNAGNGNSYSSIERIVGSSQDDVLWAGTTTMILEGGDGNDTLEGGAGDDVLIGGAGADIIVGGDGSDTVDYSASAAAVTVNFNSSAGGGDATGDRILLVENITGSSFDDALIGDANANVLQGGDGDDTLEGRGGEDRLFGGAGDDRLRGGTGADIIDGGDGIDMVDYIASTAGVTVDLSGSSAGEGGEADGDKITNVENVLGTDFDDVLTGDGGRNEFWGADGNDTLEGGAGADRLFGGAGVDTAIYSSSEEGITVNLAMGIGTGGEAEGDWLEGIENVTGSNSADVITGDPNANVLRGLAGDDMLTGGAGNDTLFGGEGNDTAVFSDVAENYQVTTDANGVMTVTHLAGGADGTDTLHGIEVLQFGDTSDVMSPPEQVISGDETGNTLTGTSADDIIHGLGGDDTILGDAGNDVIDGGEGIDTVDYSASVEGVVVNLNRLPSGKGGDADGDEIWNVENVTGSAFDDILVGGASGNVLRGGDGSDRIQGRDGDDVLMGGAGDDQLRGGMGADVIDGGDGDDTVSYINSAAGVTVDLTGSSLGEGGEAAGDQIANVENITGSAFNDVLIGNELGNVLLGHEGDDVIDGGGGTDGIDGGAGIDTVVYGSSAAGVTVNLALAMGNDGWLNGIENVAGSGYADIITGDDGDNSLFGLDGDDTVTGGAGDDIFVGGLGYDTAVFSDVYANYEIATDTDGFTTVTHLGGGADGTDTLSGIESLQFIDITIAAPTPGQTITGDEAGNVLTGTTVDDIIYGFGGNDTILGDLGNDIIDGGDGIDTVDYSTSAEGVAVSLNNIPSGVGGDANGDELWNVENLTGTALDDTLTGNASGNVLLGGAGDDVLAGGAGADIIDGGDGIDEVDFGSSTSGVTVDLSGTSPAAGGDAAGDQIANVENISGSAFNDVLTGTAFANMLSGGAGNDTLTGGKGNDTLYGGEGDDILIGDTGMAEPADYGITFGSGQIVKAAGAGNVDLASAIDVSSAFTLSDDADIANATTAPHVTISATGDGTLDYYRIEVTNPGSKITLDIDYGDERGMARDIDTYITLFDASGTLLTENDQSSTSDGGAGSVSRNDSFLTYTFADAGTYFISVGTYPDNGAVPSGGTYKLQLSLASIPPDRVDALYGGAGDDILIGGFGADILDGGTGIDTVDYSASAEGVVVNFNINPASGGDAEGDIIWDVENIIGSSFDDTLIADELDNVLTGGDGDDYLQGRDGADTLMGGAGSDRLRGGAGADIINGGDGIDTVDYGSSIVGVTVDLNGSSPGIGGDAAGDQITNVENITGTIFDDILIGNALGNVLSGYDGNDTFEGGDGADSLYGGTGIDTAIYSSSAAGVSVDLTTGLGSGGDAEGDGLSGIENLTGSAFDDTLTGDALDNMLTGGDGDDALQGGAGADSLDGGAGPDTAVYSSSAAGVTIDLAAGLASGGDAAGDQLADIENVTGSAFTDSLTGDAGNNVLRGLAGDDTLTGGTGNDNLDGGDGHDTVIFSDVYANYQITTDTTGATTVTHLAGGIDGTDTLSGIEVLQFTDGNIDISPSGQMITGDDADNILNGGAGDDIIDGLGGNDTISGNGGNDTILGGAGNDAIDGGDGTDTLSYAGLGTAITLDALNNTATVSFTDHTDTDTFVSIESFIGSAFADTINAGTNGGIYDGGAGDDTFVLQFDDYYVQIGSPATTLMGGDGVDTVNFESWFDDGWGIVLDLSNALNGNPSTGNLFDSIERVVGSAYEDWINGSGGNDILIGGDGNDELMAGDGNDKLEGGLGNDTLDGGAGNDAYSFSPGDGQDTISDTSGDDLLAFGTIDPASLWFAQSGDNLVISRLGSTDSVTISAWFASADSQIETITASDGAAALQAGEVNSLISQIAAFSAQVGSDPSAVQPTDLPLEYQVAVNSVWQAST